MGVYIYNVMPYALFLWISLVKQKKKRKGSNKKSLREREMRGDRCHLEFHVLSSKMKV